MNEIDELRRSMIDKMALGFVYLNFVPDLVDEFMGDEIIKMSQSKKEKNENEVACRQIMLKKLLTKEFDIYEVVDNDFLDFFLSTLKAQLKNCYDQSPETLEQKYNDYLKVLTKVCPSLE